MSDIVKRLNALISIEEADYGEIDRVCAEAADRIEQLERLDREAAAHVESVICMRTNFTGEPPYVGWKGLGFALSEALDERDKMTYRIEELEAENKRLQAIADTDTPELLEQHARIEQLEAKLKEYGRDEFRNFVEITEKADDVGCANIIGQQEARIEQLEEQLARSKQAVLILQDQLDVLEKSHADLARRLAESGRALERANDPTVDARNSDE